ncbi:protein SON [Salmo salar]|uniref:Protein SON-like n=1 Tax=Salmo salar TaxID=8030 RepID=A0A1S3S2X8_SALSA|nr:protein SON-like [Salmo salar]XP_045576625.1 protein SON-like [Salmo salar]|eukprot:XP_014058564.1 PREDICTED: protein SON-like [Salmo salar]
MDRNLNSFYLYISENLTAGEEFLRCLAANKPVPDFLKGLSDLGKAAKAPGVPEDLGYERQRLWRKSRSPAKESRSKSRAKSQVRSKSRPRSRSHTRRKSQARSKSRPRSRSHSRGKSQVRSKSKAHSSSRSRGRSQTRSKSRARSRSRSRGKCQGRVEHHPDHRDKRSPSRSCSGSSISSHASAYNDPLQCLKLEDSMPSIKNAILTIQANNFSREIQSSSIPGWPVSARRQEFLQVPDGPNPVSGQEVPQMRQQETDSNLLPHERVGCDFFWLQGTREVSPVQKPEEVEDEEDFLYGNEENQAKQRPATLPFAQSTTITQKSSAEVSPAGPPYYQSMPLFGNHGEIQDFKMPLPLVQFSVRPEARVQPVPAPDVKPAPAPTVKECEKIKTMLKTIGLNLGTAEISKMMIKLQQQTDGKMPEQKQEEKLALPATMLPLPLVAGESQEPRLASPALRTAPIRQALESLQSIIKATREKRADSDPHDSNHSQRNSDKQKSKDDQASKRRSRQDQMKRKETLVKELGELLKQDVSSFLIPVIGFYCQKCEEFFEDMTTAESHTATHRWNELSMQKHGDRRPEDDRQPEDDRGHPNLHSRHPLAPKRRDQRDPRDQRNPEHQRDHRHPDLKCKLGESPNGYRNDREKIYVKEEQPGSPRIKMTMFCGHTPPGLQKARGREEKGMVDKGSGAASSGPASGRHGRVKPDEVETKGKPTVEVCDKKDKDNGECSSSSDNEKSTSPKGHKKKKKKKKKDEKS